MEQYGTDIGDYSRQYLDEHGRGFSFESVLVQVRREQVLKSLGRYDHRRILEVGCGLDPLFRYCTGYETYTIVEPSREFVERASALAQGKDNIRTVCGYMEEVYKQLLESDSHVFDFILLSSLLHEVPHPDKLLQSVRAVCARETVVHINVPNVYSFHRLLAYEMGCIQSIFEESPTEAKFQRHTRFDRESLFRMVKENGFQVLSHGTYFVKPFSNEQMERIIGQNIVTSDVIKGLDAMTKYMPDLGCEMFVDVRIHTTTV